MALGLCYRTSITVNITSVKCARPRYIIWLYKTIDAFHYRRVFFFFNGIAFLSVFLVSSPVRQTYSSKGWLGRFRQHQFHTLFTQRTQLVCEPTEAVLSKGGCLLKCTSTQFDLEYTHTALVVDDTCYMISCLCEGPIRFFEPLLKCVLNGFLPYGTQLAL